MENNNKRIARMMLLNNLISESIKATGRIKIGEFDEIEPGSDLIRNYARIIKEFNKLGWDI